MKSYTFKPGHDLHWIPGQYLELTIPHDNPDQRGMSRWFTITSLPGEDIEITTKLSESSSTFKHALESLRPHDAVTLSEPMGDFVLPRDSSIPLVFVAGGIGITPFISMCKAMSKAHDERHIYFIYTVSNEDDILFDDALHRAKITPTIIVRNPSDEWGGERGSLTGHQIAALSKAPSNALYYLAGSEQTIERLQKELLRENISATNIVTDFFHNYDSV